MIVQAKKWMMVEFDQCFGLDYNLGELMSPSGNLASESFLKGKNKQWIWSVQLSASLHSRPEILSSGSVSRVWFRCQLNKTFLVSLPDARQLLSTVLRTAVQPLCTTKKISLEGHTHWKRLASPKDLLLSKEFLTKPRIMERVSWNQHHWTRVKVSKHLNFDKDELKSFWKYAKERINPAKAS